jgi:hypothetical protein
MPVALRVLVILLCSSLPGSACGTPSTRPLPRSVVIDGRVLDPIMETAVEFAIVHLSDTSFASSTVPDGRFQLAGMLSPGTYSLRVSAVGYEGRELTFTLPISDSVLHLGDVYLGVPDERGWPVECLPGTRRPGLEVQVRDSVTRTGLTGAALVIASDVEYEEVLQPRILDQRDSTVVTVAGAQERPGSYTVQVSVPGYRTWKRAGIIVSSNGCTVGTRTVLVLLQR